MRGPSGHSSVCDVCCDEIPKGGRPAGEARAESPWCSFCWGDEIICTQQRPIPTYLLLPDEETGYPR